MGTGRGQTTREQRKTHSPSNASIRNSSAHIDLRTYVRMCVLGNVYLARYGNELCARAQPGDILCIGNIPLSYSLLAPRGFRASCRRVTAVDGASLVPLNP